MMPKRIIAALTLVLVTSACAEDDSPTPVSTPTAPTSARVHDMPENFADYAEDCDGHGHRVFMTIRYENPMVVIDDPTCKEGQ